MYERFYNLRERPFSLSPDPDYLYLSRVHREALGYLRYGIEGHAGFVVITGEIGSGKTTLLQTMLRGLDRQTAVSRLVNTMLDARELVEAVMLDFGLDPGHGRSKPHLLRDLARFLVDQRMAGRLALLVIDEAQNLSLTALEEVRMLSNLETEKSKLLQILLVGQPTLRDLLARPELEQLRQRVTVSYHLQALDVDETAAYINHRLRRAAIGAPPQWTRDVTDVIHQYSQGVPRKINVISDAVLLFGYGEERRVIDVGLTRDVVDELLATGVISDPTPSAVRTTTTASEKIETAAPISPAAVASPAQSASAPEPMPTGGDATAAALVAAVPPQVAAVAAAAKTPSRVATAALDRELQQREARLAERERRVAEQQRVLMDSYRLLKDVHDTPPSAAQPAAAARAAWPPSRPLPGDQPGSALTAPSARAAYEAPRISARPYDDPPPVSETFWARLRRGLFGAGKPVETWRY